jgi:hypothetical protein
MVWSDEIFVFLVNVCCLFCWFCCCFAFCLCTTEFDAYIYAEPQQKTVPRLHCNKQTNKQTKNILKGADSCLTPECCSMWLYFRCNSVTDAYSRQLTGRPHVCRTMKPKFGPQMKPRRFCTGRVLWLHNAPCGLQTLRLPVPFTHIFRVGLLWGQSFKTYRVSEIKTTDKEIEKRNFCILPLGYWYKRIVVKQKTIDRYNFASDNLRTHSTYFCSYGFLTHTHESVFSHKHLWSLSFRNEQKWIKQRHDLP